MWFQLGEFLTDFWRTSGQAKTSDRADDIQCARAPVGQSMGRVDRRSPRAASIPGKNTVSLRTLRVGQDKARVLKLLAALPACFVLFCFVSSRCMAA